MFSIGKLSKSSGVKVSTIRYYEQIGLIEEPDRSNGNQRRYEPSALERINFIRHSRDLGLSIDTIRDLIHLSKTPDMQCQEAHEIANAQLGDIERKIVKLKLLQRELQRISTICDRGTIGHCKVLEALGDHGDCHSEH